jgi:hypothetical protein
MDTHDLYKSLAARITAEVLDQDAEKPVGYFDGIRAVVHQVVTIADETCLSASEKTRLVQRLIEHVSSLEACLPKYK